MFSILLSNKDKKEKDGVTLNDCATLDGSTCLDKELPVDSYNARDQGSCQYHNINNRKNIIPFSPRAGVFNKISNGGLKQVKVISSIYDSSFSPGRARDVPDRPVTACERSTTRQSIHSPTICLKPSSAFRSSRPTAMPQVYRHTTHIASVSTNENVSIKRAEPPCTYGCFIGSPHHTQSMKSLPSVVNTDASRSSDATPLLSAARNHNQSLSSEILSWQQHYLACDDPNHFKSLYRWCHCCMDTLPSMETNLKSESDLEELLLTTTVPDGDRYTNSPLSSVGAGCFCEGNSMDSNKTGAVPVKERINMERYMDDAAADIRIKGMKTAVACTVLNRLMNETCPDKMLWLKLRTALYEGIFNGWNTQSTVNYIDRQRNRKMEEILLSKINQEECHTAVRGPICHNVPNTSSTHSLIDPMIQSFPSGDLPDPSKAFSQFPTFATCFYSLLDSYHQMEHELHTTREALKNVKRAEIRRINRKRSELLRTAFMTLKQRVKESKMQRLYLERVFSRRNRSETIREWFRYWKLITVHTRVRRMNRLSSVKYVYSPGDTSHSSHINRSPLTVVEANFITLKEDLALEKELRDKQFRAFTYEIAELKANITNVTKQLTVTRGQKALWRSLWLTFNREHCLPVAAPDFSNLITISIKVREDIECILRSVLCSAAYTLRRLKSPIESSLGKVDSLQSSLSQEPRRSSSNSTPISYATSFPMNTSFRQNRAIRENRDRNMLSVSFRSPLSKLENKSNLSITTDSSFVDDSCTDEARATMERDTSVLRKDIESLLISWVNGMLSHGERISRGIAIQEIKEGPTTLSEQEGDTSHLLSSDIGGADGNKSHRLPQTSLRFKHLGNISEDMVNGEIYAALLYSIEVALDVKQRCSFPDPSMITMREGIVPESKQPLYSACKSPAPYNTVCAKRLINTLQAAVLRGSCAPSSPLPSWCQCVLSSCDDPLIMESIFEIDTILNGSTTSHLWVLSTLMVDFTARVGYAGVSDGMSPSTSNVAETASVGGSRSQKSKSLTSMNVKSPVSYELNNRITTSPNRQFGTSGSVSMRSDDQYVGPVALKEIPCGIGHSVVDMARSTPDYVTQISQGLHSDSLLSVQIGQFPKVTCIGATKGSLDKKAATMLLLHNKCYYTSTSTGFTSLTDSVRKKTSSSGVKGAGNTKKSIAGITSNIIQPILRASHKAKRSVRSRIQSQSERSGKSPRTNDRIVKGDGSDTGQVSSVDSGTPQVVDDRLISSSQLTDIPKTPDKKDPQENAPSVSLLCISRDRHFQTPQEYINSKYMSPTAYANPVYHQLLEERGETDKWCNNLKESYITPFNAAFPRKDTVGNPVEQFIHLRWYREAYDSTAPLDFGDYQKEVTVILEKALREKRRMYTVFLEHEAQSLLHMRQGSFTRDDDTEISGIRKALPPTPYIDSRNSLSLSSTQIDDYNKFNTADKKQFSPPTDLRKGSSRRRNGNASPDIRIYNHTYGSTMYSSTSDSLPGNIIIHPPTKDSSQKDEDISLPSYGCNSSPLYSMEGSTVGPVTSRTSQSPLSLSSNFSLPNDPLFGQCCVKEIENRDIVYNKYAARSPANGIPYTSLGSYHEGQQSAEEEANIEKMIETVRKSDPILQHPQFIEMHDLIRSIDPEIVPPSYDAIQIYELTKESLKRKQQWLAIGKIVATAVVACRCLDSR